MRILAISDEPSPRLWGDHCREAAFAQEAAACSTVAELVDLVQEEL